MGRNYNRDLFRHIEELEQSLSSLEGKFSTYRTEATEKIGRLTVQVENLTQENQKLRVDKVSGGFRTPQGKCEFCAAKSVIETIRRTGQSVLDAIRETLNNTPAGVWGGSPEVGVGAYLLANSAVGGDCPRHKKSLFRLSLEKSFPIL